MTSTRRGQARVLVAVFLAVGLVAAGCTRGGGRTTPTLPTTDEPTTTLPGPGDDRLSAGSHEGTILSIDPERLDGGRWAVQARWFDEEAEEPLTARLVFGEDDLRCDDGGPADPQALRIGTYIQFDVTDAGAEASDVEVQCEVFSDFGEALPGARKRWEALRASTYAYTLSLGTRSDGCGGASPDDVAATYRITVSGGEPGQVEPLDTDAELPDLVTRLFPDVPATMDALFDRLERFVNLEGAAAFDPRLGVPTDLLISAWELVDPDDFDTPSTVEVAVYDLAGEGIPGSAPAATVLTVPLAERAPVTAADAAEGARIVNAFGADLYRQVAAGSSDNLVLSPWSIATALGMTRAGARGETAAQIDRVLHAGDEAALHQGLSAVEQAAMAANGPFDTVAGRPREVVVNAANTLFGQEGYPFADAFRASVRRQYGADLQSVDYETSPEEARRAINGWVSDRTAGRIPELLPGGVVTTATRLALVNAVRISAPWQQEFGEPFDGPFTVLGGSTVTAPLMPAGGEWQYGAGDGWQAVEVPYGDGDLAMLVLVPDTGRFPEVERGLSGEWLATVDAALETRTVSLTLPQWDDDEQVALKDALEALGMPVAFTPEADLTGISATGALQIDQVVHAATITVDEEGTEAAAASAVLSCDGAAPIEDLVDLVVDRPFLYALRHVDSGAVLFLGRVLDPTV